MPHLYDLNPHLAPKDWKSKAAPKKSGKDREPGVEQEESSNAPGKKRGRPKKDD
tara:strand:+ start:2082 stop:2243 length:162 start_codon:yes stop_codon:yes gene_type:complete